MTSDVRITVAMPAFDVADVVGEAIESVLAQSLQDFELIVIDDGSSDATAERIACYANHPKVCVFYNNANLGSGATRNRILTQARGRYWMPCDADDLLLPGALADLSEFLDRHADVGVVYGNVLRLDTEAMALLREPEVVGTDANQSWDLFENAVNHGGSMIRTDLMRRVGGYTPGAMPDDWDLFLKLSEIARIHYLAGQVYYVWRVRPSSQSRKHVAPTEIIRAAVERRRKNGCTRP